MLSAATSLVDTGVSGVERRTMSGASAGEGMNQMHRPTNNDMLYTDSRVLYTF